jgi:hypothetical protein
MSPPPRSPFPCSPNLSFSLFGGVHPSIYMATAHIQRIWPLGAWVWPLLLGVVWGGAWNDYFFFPIKLRSPLDKGGHGRALL